MDTLGRLRYERGVDALTQLFQYYKQGELAEAALDALARIAHPASTPLFVSQLASTIRRPSRPSRSKGWHVRAIRPR